MRRSALLVIAMSSVAGAMAPRVARAQASAASGSVAGVVRDSAGVAIAGAEISIAGTSLVVESAVDGAFRIAKVSGGDVTVRVRRVGFRPKSVDIKIDGERTPALDLRLARMVQPLPAVLVNARNRGRDLTNGFEDRRLAGHGHFMTREDIEHWNPSTMTDLFRRIPGVRLVATRYIRNAIRFRNASCPPLVWLDGFPLASAEFDVDNFLPESIEAMEVYSGPSTVPIQFTTFNTISQCGTIVLWSREGEPRQRRDNGKTASAELAALIDAHTVFTADQVDIPARPDTATIRPAYPDSLYRARVPGMVVAEFVVDSVGEVSMDQFSIVASTHPLFSEAVRRALPVAKFIPARRAGRAVRQAVQWPFRFSVDSAAASK
ncbi:MAG: TonB family protein [Gemmatimonadota bacterium]|nr:TonB family protein [Gemmatimonadota bacterium]